MLPRLGGLLGYQDIDADTMALDGLVCRLKDVETVELRVRGDVHLCVGCSVAEVGKESNNSMFTGVAKLMS
jgi:hypothetical protein